MGGGPHPLAPSPTFGEGEWIPALYRGTGHACAGMTSHAKVSIWRGGVAPGPGLTNGPWIAAYAAMTNVAVGMTGGWARHAVPLRKNLPLSVMVPPVARE